MNESLQDKFDQLTIELKRRRRNCRRSLRNIFVFCIITLLFFVLYSALICYRIREIATPSTVALLIAGQLREQFSNELKAGEADFRRTAEDMSQSALLALPVGIHAGGELLKDSMKREARSAAFYTAQQLTDSLHRNIDRMMADPSVSAEILKQVRLLPSGNGFDFPADIERTLMFPHPLYFGGRLREIRLKKNAELTQQDLCDRDFILCWLYLNENDRYRDARYAKPLLEIFNLFVRSWEEAATEMPMAPAQKNTNKIPVPKKMPAMQ